MKVYVEDYDDELHADPIKLFFDENHNSGCSLNNITVKDVSNTPSESNIETIDLTGPSNFEVVKMPKPCKPKYSDVCYKVKQLAVQLVDLKKFPWYYKKYFKYYREDNDITKGIIVGDIENITSDMYMKIKYDNNKGEWQIHEGNTNTLQCKKSTANTQTTLHGNINKIDFKRNKGLVGMTITQIIKEERVDPSLVELESKGEVMKDKSVLNKETSKRETDLILKDGVESEVIKIILPPNATKSTVKETIEGKIKDSNIVSDQNDEKVIKSQPTELLDADSNKHMSNNLKAVPQKNTTNSHFHKDKLVTSTKRHFFSPKFERIKKNYIRKERKSACFICEVQRGEIISKNCEKESKNTYDSSIEKILPVPVSDANPKGISTLPLISERKVAVIDSTSKQFQDIKRFVEKTTKPATTNTLKHTEKGAFKCNKSKALDMPILIEENDDKSNAPSHRRTSLKDCIVFENDLNSNDYFGNKKPEKHNDTLATEEQKLENNHLLKLLLQKSQNSNSVLAGNVTTTFQPTSTHTTPVVSHVNSSGFRPRIKYTPMNKDYTTPTNHNIISTNYSDYVRHLQSLSQCPSTVSSVRHNNVQNRNKVQVLNDARMSDNTAAIMQHQQISQFGAPPSYQSHYQVAPGYATPFRNRNSVNDYSKYGNNQGDGNPNFYYDNKYSRYVAPPQFSAPPSPLPPPPAFQTPQWQSNISYNQDVLIHNPNSPIIGWNNRNVGQTNIVVSSATCNPNFSNNGDKRLISVDDVRAQISNPVDDMKLNKNRAPQTPHVVIGSNSTDKTLKRPYKKKSPRVKRTLNSELEKNLEVLSKRSRTAPLPVSSQVKCSTYSPPILPIPTYENMLSEVYNPKQPTKVPTVNVTGDGKTKYVKGKPSPELLDNNSMKISVEEYKKRFAKSDSANSNSLISTEVGDRKDRAGLVPKYATKTLKSCNYSLNHDLGFNSDTNIKL